VVRAPESQHLKGEHFLAEIVWRAKPARVWTRLPSVTPWNGVVLGRS
jgi:hypothetical protein